MLKLYMPKTYNENCLNEVVKKYRKLKKPTVANLQDIVTYYIRVMYPNVIFRMDISAIKKRLDFRFIKYLQPKNNVYPSLFIAEPSGEFHGLYIEFVAETENIYNKSGKLKSDELRKKKEMLDILYSKGYYTAIGAGYMSCIDTINSYLNSNGKVR